jgi:hypothetical protein
MRRAARVDSNPGDIIAALRRVGCTVLDMSRLGGGAPDIAIGYGGLTMLAEIKDGSKAPSARRLTEDEQKFHNTWTGGVRVIQCVEDAMEAASVVRAWAVALRDR